jgi:glycosyltransferase involved in cell wall biosynthesis
MIPNPLPELFLSNPIQRNGIGSPGPIRVGFAASNVLDPIKGFESISDVLASAQAEGLIKVTTAGRISVSGKRKYPQFTHLGKLSQQEMLRFYDEIDLLVVPSTEEAAGMVALEAMARGVVPVVKTTGGLQELVDNQNGYLFSDSRDLNSILNAIDPLALVGKRFSGLAMATSRSPRSVAAKYLDFGTSLRPSK